MADPPRMNERQFSRVKKLIRRLCANYDKGNCLLLDDGYDPCLCPQLISNTLLCRYFRTAVLPNDLELLEDILSEKHICRCVMCGGKYAPSGNRAVYCAKCAAVREKKRKAEWARKNRERRRRLDTQKR